MNVDAFKFLSPRLWPDLFEILLVSFVVYRFLLFLVGTRALQIVIGLVILSLTYFVAVFAKFTMISTLLGVVFTYGAFAAVMNSPASHSVTVGASVITYPMRTRSTTAAASR